ncbi:MAG: MBL fold metallo-hydrolase, partial [Actinobacteria bacterium]|nr:MBL fold metallo-hydrolase [Actinomycetota bacterium]
MDVTPEQPYQVADETWVIPHLFPVPLAGNLYINSLVIRGREPILVDTGSPVVKADWLRAAWSIVDPVDVRWVFVSHDDGDHVGNLAEVLEACPNATVVASWMAFGHLFAHGRGVPPERSRIVADGETFTAGDRTLLAFRPPIYDSPSTRALFDTTTGVLWGSDAFGGFVPGPVHDARDLPDADWSEGVSIFSRLISPWHGLVDDAAFQGTMDRLVSLGADTVASCHGPALH